MKAVVLLPQKVPVTFCYILTERARHFLTDLIQPLTIFDHFDFLFS